MSKASDIAKSVPRDTVLLTLGASTWLKNAGFISIFSASSSWVNPLSFL